MGLIRRPGGCMSLQEIAAARPRPVREDADLPLALAREAMVATGQWHPLQSMGRRWSIGCVALEITQRCNLDCTLCYLSDHSEAVKDVPLAEILRRVDAIAHQYGPNTEVQITGGDPTLRDRTELITIVRHVRASGLLPNLFTNGIRATRSLLTELAAAGLADVAFHVDTTQERKGYTDEVSLNPLREAYIARARGLGLGIVFNTTVHDGNLAEIPDVAAFFVQRASTVRLASFQLQAETGRGTAGGSEGAVSIDGVAERIQRGAGARIAFDTPLAGHSDCNRHALVLVSGGEVLDLYDDKKVMAMLLAGTVGQKFERMSRARGIMAFAGRLLRQPRLAATLLPWATRKAWGFRRALWQGRGQVERLSFFIHDFMDARSLDRCRIEACVFMVQTADGPVSMCLHNAKRDDFILAPLRIVGQATPWNPLTGGFDAVTTPVITPKNAKGRVRISRIPRKEIGR